MRDCEMLYRFGLSDDDSCGVRRMLSLAVMSAVRLLLMGALLASALFGIGHLAGAHASPQPGRPSSEQPPEPQQPTTQEKQPQQPPAQPRPSAEEAPAQPAPEQAQQGVPIGFRLENADLLQVINIIAGHLKLNYVVDPAVKGTVTINTAGELRREDLLPVLETILKINGATAIQTGNFYRIVPLAQAPKTALPVFSDATGKTLPTDDRVIMQIIPLRFVSAADMAKMLTPFLSDGGSIAVHEAGNILVVADNSLNMKRLMEILAQFDNAEFAQQRVRLVPVRNNVASSLVPELESIFAAYALSAKNTPLRFVPIDRINGILVVTPDPAGFVDVEKWIAKLDQPAPPSGIQTFVYRVANSEADYLARLLSSMYAGAPVEAAPAKGSAMEPARPVSAAGVRITPDPVNNSLIIQSTAQAYAEMAKTLMELDVVPRQVLIEARVYEVTLTGDLSFGLSYFLQQRSGKERKPLASFTAATGLQASAGMLIGNARELLSFLNASENRSRVRVISAPTVLATDNSDAKIQVGSEVPILTSQAVTGAQVSGTTLFTNTIQNRDTGVILTVTPRITSTGMVSLKIAQEISTAQSPPAGAIQSPTFQKRLVATRAVVLDGETVALGGLMQTSVTLGRNRVPLLGDIPGLGLLFGQTTRSTVRTELVILLTPRIIPDVPAFRDGTRELTEKLRELRRGFKKDRTLNPVEAVPEKKPDNPPGANNNN